MSDGATRIFLKVLGAGLLSDSVFSEYSTYPAEGRTRATGEDRTWF